MTRETLKALTTIPGCRAILLETYGSGNAPSGEWFTDVIREAVGNGKIVLNITQCHAGSVDMKAYSTGITLLKAGVVSGADSTTEAAVAKLFFLLGQYSDNKSIIENLQKNMRGEISE